MPRFPIHPKNPERICWGCDRLCSADNLLCGNGTVRTQHPAEIFGDDWAEWLAEKNSPGAAENGDQGPQDSGFVILNNL